MLKQIAYIATWSLVKKSAKWSMAIIGAISTIMAVVGVSLIDLLPKGSGCLFRLFVFVVLFILMAILAAVVTYRRSRSGVHLAINGMDIDIVVGDLFATDGVKVIPFDEYFDIQVDDKVISRNSLNGIFIKRYADWNTLKRTVEKLGPSLLEPCKAGDGRIRYPLGTIKDYNEYALLAFTHMDKLNRARLRRGEYEECLLNMWDELDRMYAGRPVVLPLLGSGITRFDGGKPSEDDLLRCMLCTLRASKRHFKEGVVVVLTEKTAARMRLYEVNGYIEAWEIGLERKMVYRTRTYIAADWDGDRDAVDQLHKWNDSDYWGLSFTDAHNLQQSRDSSLPCSIKSSLKERMDHSKRFVLIVGDSTDTVTKGSCRYCGSYNAWTSSCARMHSVDYRSYIKYECDKAMEADIDIVVLYNNTRVDRSKCPEAVRYHGNHVAMMYYRNGKYYWDYPAVKKALQ